MMIEPGITELSKCVDSRYTLVAMAAKRARMIGSQEHGEDYVAPVEKPVSIAAREIAEGKVGFVRSERIANSSAKKADEEIISEDTGAPVIDAEESSDSGDEETEEA